MFYISVTKNELQEHQGHPIKIKSERKKRGKTALINTPIPMFGTGPQVFPRLEILEKNPTEKLYGITPVSKRPYQENQRVFPGGQGASF